MGGHSLPSGCCHFYFYFLSSSPGVYSFIAPWSAFAEWHVSPGDTTLKKNPLIRNYKALSPSKNFTVLFRTSGFSFSKEVCVTFFTLRFYKSVFNHIALSGKLNDFNDAFKGRLG